MTEVGCLDPMLQSQGAACCSTGPLYGVCFAEFFVDLALIEAAWCGFVLQPICAAFTFKQ